MLRKTVLALAAVAAIGTAALAPTSASAHGLRFHPGFGWGGWGYGPTYFPGNCYVVKKYTPFGVKIVKVCNYY